MTNGSIAAHNAVTARVAIVWRSASLDGLGAIINLSPSRLRVLGWPIWDAIARCRG
jgi:hypothetical protein